MIAFLKVPINQSHIFVTRIKGLLATHFDSNMSIAVSKHFRKCKDENFNNYKKIYFALKTESESDQHSLLQPWRDTSKK